MKKTILPLLLMAVIIGSCNSTKPETLTEEQKLAIIEEVKIVDAAIAEAIINKDADATFSSMDPDNFLRFIDNGRVMEDYNSTVSGFRESYAGLDSVSLEFTDRKYTVLSPTLVLSTSRFTEDATTMDGNTISLKGAVTGVMQKRGDTWQLIHAHQSYYPVQNQ